MRQQLTHFSQKLRRRIGIAPTQSAPAEGRYTLSQADVGRPLRLLQLDADRQLAHRLNELGLTPGVELSVVHKSGGALMVAVRGSRVGVCSRTASHMHVEPLL